MAAIILIIIMVVLFGLIFVRPVVPGLVKFREEYSRMGPNKKRELWTFVGIFVVVCIGSLVFTLGNEYSHEGLDDGGNSAILVGGVVLAAILAIIAVCLFVATRKKNDVSEGETDDETSGIPPMKIVLVFAVAFIILLVAVYGPWLLWGAFH